MMKLVVAYAATLIVFVAIDFVFLGTVGAKMYRATLLDVMAPEFNVAAAVLFYLVFTAGVLYFAVFDALRQDRLMLAAQNGAVLGFIAYATYDLTALAVIRNWTWSLALIDILWGIVVTAVAATIATVVTDKLVG